MNGRRLSGARFAAENVRLVGDLASAPISAACDCRMRIVGNGCAPLAFFNALQRDSTTFAQRYVTALLAA